MTTKTLSQRPIGVFDSGLGGLTAVRELRRILPGEDIVYLGDTARVPYGSRGQDTILEYTRQDIAFLLAQNVKVVLAACGTASSAFPPGEAAALPVGYLGVVTHAAAAAAAATQNGRVGVLGTAATIASQSFQTALAALNPRIAVTAQACPLFVPLVENGHFAKGDAMANLAAKEYLPGVKTAGVDTLILGCTHYPLLAGVIAEYMGPAVTLIDTGRQAALALQAQLQAAGLLAAPGKKGATHYYVTDDPARFGRLAELFLRQPAQGDVRRVEIETYR